MELAHRVMTFLAALPKHLAAQTNARSCETMGPRDKREDDNVERIEVIRNVVPQDKTKEPSKQ
jgi:hypothetical protein